jgi:hypothetical protein
LVVLDGAHRTIHETLMQIDGGGPAHELEQAPAASCLRPYYAMRTPS